MGDSSSSSSLYFSKCLVSPTCYIPKHEEYSRLPPPPRPRRVNSHRSRGLWRKLLSGLLKESNKCIYRSCSFNNNNNKIKGAPVTFQYDAISYSQNFDEGRHIEDFNHFQRFSSLIENRRVIR
ncbi:hypothetical protein RND81_13G180700 [Saponaria officinalis]|uniref:Uncharacterized protein n=1 Tax=Saponaria officinalis TaxID=3572 RepID=A0AAW1H3V9_SAPOF